MNKKTYGYLIGLFAVLFVAMGIVQLFRLDYPHRLIPSEKRRFVHSRRQIRKQPKLKERHCASTCSKMIVICQRRHSKLFVCAEIRENRLSAYSYI